MFAPPQHGDLCQVTLIYSHVGRFRRLSLNTDEFIPPEAGPPFGWIEPEIAQHPKST